jgi:hypothetical protein
VNEEDWKKAFEKMKKSGIRVEPRIVDHTTYKVLESMVNDGLISGAPYSEFSQFEEFQKRMNKAKGRSR